MTPRAEGMILAELYRLKSAGHDPNAALQQSELHCWLDVYAPRTRSPVQAHAVSFYEAEQAAKSARVAEMTGGLVSANLPGFGDVIENQARIAS